MSANEARLDLSKRPAEVITKQGLASSQCTARLWARMGEDMDINCGDVIDGVPLADKGAEIYRMMLDVASGRPTKSEAQGFGRVEFIPWQIGAVM